MDTEWITGLEGTMPEWIGIPLLIVILAVAVFWNGPRRRR